MIPWEVHVGDINHDLIIGIDLLEFLKMKIDFGENQLTIGGKIITWEDNVGVMKEETQEVGQKSYKILPVKLENKLKIPGESELVIPIKGFDVGSETILLKPFDKIGSRIG